MVTIGELGGLAGKSPGSKDVKKGFFYNFTDLLSEGKFWFTLMVVSIVFVVISITFGGIFPTLQQIKLGLFMMIVVAWLSVAVVWKLLFGKSIPENKAAIFPYLLAIVLLGAMWYFLIVYAKVDFGNIFSSVQMQNDLASIIPFGK